MDGSRKKPVRVPKVASESKIHDQCLWNLSLVLKEIAENSDAVEKELPRRVRGVNPEKG